MRCYITTIFIWLFLLVGLGLSAQAQKNNDWGVGLRFGAPNALTIKHYSANNALDISIGAAPYGFVDHPDGGYYRGGSRYGFSLMMNYEWRKTFKTVPSLQYYVGLGGLMAVRNYYRNDKDNRTDDGYYSRVSFGPTAVLGIEWFIPNAPIALFAELTPYVEIFPAPFYINPGAGIGGRFIF
jgi:hypothetical protein